MLLDIHIRHLIFLIFSSIKHFNINIVKMCWQNSKLEVHHPPLNLYSLGSWVQLYPWLITDNQARRYNKQQHLKGICKNMKKKKKAGTTTNHPFTDNLTWKIGSHTCWYLNGPLRWWASHSIHYSRKISITKWKHNKRWRKATEGIQK